MMDHKILDQITDLGTVDVHIRPGVEAHRRSGRAQVWLLVGNEIAIAEHRAVFKIINAQSDGFVPSHGTEMTRHLELMRMHLLDGRP